MSGDVRASGEEGFTLVELLVALALLSLMAVYVVAALQHASRMKAVSERVADDASVEAVATHLRRAIEGTRMVYQRPRSASPVLAFHGASTSLSLITVSDGRLEIGGLYVAEFGLGAPRAGHFRSLITRRRLFRPGDGEVRGETVSLLDDIESLRFRYFGSPGPEEQPGWMDEWARTDALPRIIEVTVTFPEGDRREWVPLAVGVPVAW